MSFVRRNVLSDLSRVSSRWASSGFVSREWSRVRSAGQGKGAVGWSEFFPVCWSEFFCCPPGGLGSVNRSVSPATRDCEHDSSRGSVGAVRDLFAILYGCLVWDRVTRVLGSRSVLRQLSTSVSVSGTPTMVYPAVCPLSSFDVDDDGRRGGGGVVDLAWPLCEEQPSGCGSLPRAGFSMISKTEGHWVG